MKKEKEIFKAASGRNKGDFIDRRTVCRQQRGEEGRTPVFRVEASLDHQFVALKGSRKKIMGG